MKPLLPLNRSLRQRAIATASRSIAELTKTGKYCIPVAPYARDVCKIFRIPLLPMESPVTVAVKKLEEWRFQVRFRTVVDAEIVAVLPQLESLVKAIRIEIAGKVVSSTERKWTNKRRKKYREKKEVRA